MDKDNQKAQVVIIGGGMAGLLMARVLSDYYQDILIIDRDNWPKEPELRAGTPQAFHLHQLLPRGDMILEQLFPGYADELLENGASQRKNTVVEMVNQYGTLMMPVQESGVTCSRTLLEWVLRKRVQALPQVRFLAQMEVTGLETTPDRTRVTGVTVRPRGRLEMQVTVSAELVVDASGRSSRLAQWFATLGYTLPEDERVNAGVGYSTRYYKIPAQRQGSASLILLESDPTTKMPGAVLMTVENNTWMVCIASAGGQYPSIDAEAYEQELTQLISPRLAEVLQEAEPLSAPRGYRIPECVRHHYEQMEQWPAGLLASGDALCHFDPIYGQGITMAAIGAETVAACLKEQGGQPQPGFERQVLRKIQDALYPAWWRSTIEDLRWSGATHNGPQTPEGVTLLHRYLNLCLRQATRQFAAAAQTGTFDERFLYPLMMNWMLVSPRDVVNADMLKFLLSVEEPAEQERLLSELFQGYDQPIEQALAEIVPDFSFTFDLQAAFAGEAAS